MPLPKAIAAAASEADAAVEALMAAESAPLTVDPNTGQPPAAPVTPEPAVRPPPQTEDFEAKYRSMKGRYDAEVPTLKAQVQTYERINSTLSAQNADLTERLARFSAANAAPVVATEVVTPKDMESYGPELIDLIGRISSATTARERAQILDEVKRATGTVSTQVADVKAAQKVTDKALFEQRLTELQPDWRDLDVRTDWHDWLRAYDPLMGAVRQVRLNEAYSAWDAPRVHEFIKAWLATLPPVSPVPLTPQEELARQVQPRSVPPANFSTAVGDVPNGKKIWTQQEIGEAFNAKLQGKFKHRPDEWAALSHEIDVAAAEGRVR